MSSTNRNNVRVLIVEDHTLFADSLELALSMEGYDVQRVPVTQESGSTASLLAAVLRARPRIMLLDLDLGRAGDGTRLIGPVAKTGVNVVVVTAAADRARWGECYRYGARKVISKAAPLNETLATVRRLSQGLPVLDVRERDELLRMWHTMREERQQLRERLDLLTVREREVLGELMLGHTVAEIARASVVSEATVRTQVKAILAKLQVSSQLAAVGLAHHVGWQPPNVREGDTRHPVRQY